ncbi:MAG: hypothetical protein FJZ38_20150 [Candidatus Rokubacteria bacterium]|nr:hypothetical protein [Candidatus Rokubacteria bacterium]
MWVLRLGCSGCLTVLILIALVGGGAWATFQAMRTPDVAGGPVAPSDGFKAQQKIFEVIRRSGSGRPHTVTLSEREVNAFLARHLVETADMPLRNLGVRLPADGHADIAGQLPLRQLLGVAPLSALTPVLPAGWLDRGVWLAIRARVTLEGTGAARDRRWLRLDVQQFWIGRLPLPEVMLRVLLDPAALRLLRSPMPEAIDGVRIEPGRLIIQTS